MSSQVDFLRHEFWILSWSGSVQRALRYIKGTPETERRKFRYYMIDYCERDLLPKYCSPVSEEQHVANIVALRNHAERYSNPRLLAKPYSIGVSQKLLNLQLKYLWCAGLIPMPPHCPIDRVVLGFTCLKGRMNWTAMTSSSDYLRAIEAVRKAAGDKPIAKWELEIYNKQRL